MATLRQRATERTIYLLVANFIRFKHDHIIEFREFMDSFDLVEQVLGPGDRRVEATGTAVTEDLMRSLRSAD